MLKGHPDGRGGPEIHREAKGGIAQVQTQPEVATQHTELRVMSEHFVWSLLRISASWFGTCPSMGLGENGAGDGDEKQ